MCVRLKYFVHNFKPLLVIYTEGCKENLKTNF